MRANNVFGITGWKNSGKTTLIVALVDEFTRRGLRVSTIKHAHHAFDIDVPGKDSYRHRQAGASEVLVGSGARWALMHELRGEAPPSLDDLLVRLSPCDLVLVEGFKGDSHPKLEVTQQRESAPLIADFDASVVAVVTDHSEYVRNRTTFALSDVPGIADFICRICDIEGRQMRQPASDSNHTR